MYLIFVQIIRTDYQLFVFSDEIIGRRNQDNGLLGRIGEVKSRDVAQDGVSSGKLAISPDIDLHEILIHFFSPT